ncbi:MAG: aspartyl protease family protein [Thaumarchaeota archaeon]|nr:aspartyl protease family protein [Nitrososphaerota archaeon]
MKMGETHVAVRIVGPMGDAEVEMLVDTGATLTKIPRSIAKSLGVKPRELVEAELADGRVIERDASEVELELNGQRWTVPLLIGADDEEPLLGLTALETFRLKVNPVTQKLEPATLIEYAERQPSVALTA